jgi:membrane-associated phospholipid phosphatase
VTADGTALRPLHRRLRGARTLRDGTTLYWWIEIVCAVVFYLVYSTIRNVNGNDPGVARRNALKLMDWQQALGINHERAIQEWALNFKPLIIACNYFYGSLHFVLTAGILVFLYRKFPDEYPLWRNTLAIATALALVGFTFFPLMPPRLLPDHFGFVDTLDRYPTPWTFKSGAVNKVSNQFAAMPSVHCTWALWCALVLVSRLRRRWLKVLAVLYPVATMVTIVLTGNHFFLDIVGGFAALGLGYWLARALTRAGRRATPDEPPPNDADAPLVPV